MQAEERRHLLSWKIKENISIIFTTTRTITVLYLRNKMDICMIERDLWFDKIIIMY